MEKELIKNLKRIGSLKDMNQAIRLITNYGYTVIGWEGLTISVLGHGDIEFTETAEGRIKYKK